MHAIQTSGNCVRNVTADHLAGSPPMRSMIRVPTASSSASGRRCIRNSPTCRASSRSRLPARRPTAPPPKCTTSACTWCAMPAASSGFEVLVGGGLGRTPILGQVIREFLPLAELLAYLEAILRVYNRHGRRDNIHKARIKILVKALGIERFREQVEAEWRSHARARAAPAAERDRARARLLPAARPTRPSPTSSVPPRREPSFAAWYRYNTRAHRVPGYRAVFVSLKAHGSVPGDMTRGADGSAWQPRRARELRPDPRHAQPEPAAGRCAAARALRRVARAASA